jgi:hypothetical protein
MAQPIQCDEHADRPAYVLISRLTDGETMALCEECWQGFLLAASRGVEATSDAVVGAEADTETAQAAAESSEEPATFLEAEPEEEAPALSTEETKAPSDKRRGARPHGGSAPSGEQSDGRPGADLVDP